MLLTGPESHSTKWYLMIECEAILGNRVTLTTDIQTTLCRGMFEKNPALSKPDSSDAEALGSSCFVSAALSVPDKSKFSLGPISYLELARMIEDDLQKRVNKAGNLLQLLPALIV